MLRPTGPAAQRMRILLTNDDGVFAPGIAALARTLAARYGDGHELTVVAPLTDHSGTGAAVGPVYEREAIPYEPVEIPGLSHLPVYGVDGPPALCVILACIGGFGRRPDVVVSGINHGMNAGRSALHSGTIGAALTGAQLGVSGLAVSIAWSEDPVPWETPAELAADLVPLLVPEPGKEEGAPPGTPVVLNLNVPALPPDQLRGVAHGRLGSAGLIRGVRPESTPGPVAGPAIDRTGGAVVLDLRGQRGADRAAEEAELAEGSDAALVAAGWASLTALIGVREDRTAAAGVLVDGALARWDAQVGSSSSQS